MEENIRKKIIEEYKKGKSSLKIEKIVGLSRPTILKVLHENNLIRKRDRCKSLKILNDGQFFFVIRKCPMCNLEVKTYSKDKIIACRNHFNSSKRNCKKCSLKLQEGEGNPFYGRKHSKESIEKISKKRKGQAMGENNSMSNPKWRKKVSDNLKKIWSSGKLENTRKLMSEHMKNSIKKGKIKFQNFSKKEIEIVHLIEKLGYEVKHLHRIDTKICDIYIPKLNLIIEYFGDYWHCNPKKYNENYFNQKKNKYAKEIWEYDSNKIDLIKNNGYNFEVIWESELKNDDKLINKIIDNYVKSK